MSFDFHFDDGRHEKHSNWTMWSFAMLLLRYYNVWSQDQLEAEMMQLAMKKTSQGKLVPGKRTATQNVDSKTMKKIDSYMRRRSLTVTVEPLGEEEDEASIVEAYAAKVDLRNDSNTWRIPLTEAPKFIQDYFKDTAEESMRLAVESTKLTKRLLDLLMKVRTPMEDDLFLRLLSNDGLKISPSESNYLVFTVLNGFKEFLTDGNRESLQILKSRFVAMGGHFAYAAGSHQNITIR